MTAFHAEIIGTLILILLGNGVVCNVVLDKTKGNSGGWLLINFGWGLAVFAAVVVAGPYSGAHLNPAVTIGLAAAGKFAWSNVLPYLAAQSIGAAIASVLLVIMYRDHYLSTASKDAKLATFATGPEIRSWFPNLASEMLGTFVLVIGALFIIGPELNIASDPDAVIGLGSVGALPIALFVVVIGMSLGGTTGYAINPVRDLIPRFMHGILPIGEKRDSDWSYSWIPIVGPLLGAIQAAGLYLLIL